MTGFITTMHGSPAEGIPAISVGDTFWNGSNPLTNRQVGTVRRICTRTDTAFVELSSGVTLSRIPLNYNGVIIGPNHHPNSRLVTGMRIIRFSEGGSTPARGDGDITRLRAFNYVPTVGNIQLMRSNHTLAAGDSGGVLARSMPVGSYYIVGIVSSTCPTTREALFSTIEDIMSTSNMGARPIL